MKCKIYKKH